jgi:hypothetical protein
MVKEINDKLPTNYNELPAELADLTEQDSGKGVSFRAEDQLIPLIYVLQSNSPIVDKRSDAHVNGAEPGHFWLRNSVHPIQDGIEGFMAIPCGMRQVWIEWLPNRGGFVARHDNKPADTETRIIKGDDGRERQALLRANGNLIQDTREFFLLVEGMPFVLPCSGTKHSFAKQWQTMFHQFKHPKTRQVMPSFARKYRLYTVPQQNTLGKWFGIKFEDKGFVTAEEYTAARALNDALEAGIKHAEAPMAEHAATSGDGDIPF